MNSETFFSWLLSSLSFLGTKLETNSLNPSNNISRPFTILVEGNVGSGKSTFLSIMENFEGVQVFPEPVDQWQQVGGLNLLHDMYAEPHRWTTAFQLYSSLTRTRIGLQAKDSTSPVVILERSLYSERFCFVQMLYESGVIAQGEFALLDRWFHRLTQPNTTGMGVDLIVYIQSEPDRLLQRISGRGRKEEEGVSLTFLKELDKRHDDWLLKDKAGYVVPAAVELLDGNQNLEDFTNSVMKWAGKRGLKKMPNYAVE